MKKKVNKFCSLVMAFFMIFTIFSPIANALNATDKGSIIVEDVEEGVTVSAYKIMNVLYGEDGPIDPGYEWVNESLKGWIEENFPNYSNVKNFNSQISEDDAKEFYDKLAAAIRGNKIELTVSQTATVEKGTETSDDSDVKTGSVTITDLEMGNYLILIENGLKVYSPSAVNLIPVWQDDAWTMSEAKVKIKSSEVGINKTVNKSSVKIDDTVTYTIEANVPQFPANAPTRNYVISDIIDTTLGINYNSIIVKGSKGTTSVNLTKDNDYSVSLAEENPTLKSATEKKVNFQYVFDYSKISIYDTITIEYTAKVLSNVTLGTDGNKNTAYLEYSNNPYGEDNYKLKESSIDIYSYGIQITKTGDKNGDESGLAGAEFVLNTSDTSSETDNISFIKVEDGEYRLATSEDATSDKTETLETDATGKLVLRGLDQGTYYLWETKAPGGYNKPTSPTTIVITDDDYNGSVQVADGYNDKGIVQLSIKNKSGFSLPDTGGIGTILFTIGGIILMGIGVIIIRSIRKKREC